MKRSISITILFVGLNILIFWITSMEPGQTENAADDPLAGSLDEPEELLEKPPVTATVAAESSTRTPRPLLLSSQNEVRERMLDEIQQGAARAIPSLARVSIYWKNADGVWDGDHVTAVCVDGDGLYATSWERVSRGELFRIQHRDGSISECRLDSFDPAKGIALFRSAAPEKSSPTAFTNGLSVPFGSALQFIWLDPSNQPQAARGHLSGVTYDAKAGFPDVVSGYLLPDMALEKGQRGGMLIDREGRMVGLLLDGTRETGPAAVLSAEDVLHACRYLKQYGYVSRSEFGISTQRLNPDLVRGFGWEESTGGIVVTRVRPGLPAGRAGIREGDLIVELNGRRVTRSGFFQSVLSRWPEDKLLALGVWRDGEIEQLELTGIPMPKTKAPSLSVDTPEENREPLDPAEALAGESRQVVVSGEAGEYFVLSGIDPRQVLFSPPLRAGDIVVRLSPVRADTAGAEDGNTSTDPLTGDRLREAIFGAGRAVMLCYRDGQYFWTSARPLVVPVPVPETAPPSEPSVAE